ncbi:MAG: hypothetical protein AB7U20_14295 [Planctomycetaceae bacterium]
MPLTTLNELHAELRRHFECLTEIRCDDIEVADLISDALEHARRIGQACEHLRRRYATTPNASCDSH